MERLSIAGQKVSLKHTIILGWIFILLVPILSVIAAPQRSKFRRQAAAKTLEVSNVPRVDSDDGGIWYPTIDVDDDEFVTADSSSGQNTADKPGNSKQEHEKHEVSVNNDHSVQDHTIYDTKEDSEIKSEDSFSSKEKDHTIYDTKEDSEIKSEDSFSSKENSEEIDNPKADTANGSASDENEDWVKTIRTLFKNFGFRDDEIPEPFGTKKTNDIEELSPEFVLILHSLTANVPPRLKQQLDEILHSEGFKDSSVNSHDKTHLLTKLGKTVKEVQSSFGHETRHSSVSESQHVKTSSKSKSSDESKHSRKHEDENSYENHNRQQQLYMPQGNSQSQSIQHNNENTQLKLNIDAETNKIKKEISEIAQLELIRHQKHQTGERDAKETNKISQLINDIHDLGEKEKLQKQQMLGRDHFVAQNGKTAGNTYNIDEHNYHEDSSSGNFPIETKSSHEHHDYIDHDNGAVSSVDIHKTVKTNSGPGHHETVSDENNIFQDVKKIVEEEIAEGHKLNEEHERHKAEMMEVIRKLKFSDTSEEDKERIETIQNIIEQIDREHYKELDLQMKLDALVQSHEGYSRRSAHSKDYSAHSEDYSAHSKANQGTNTVELDEIKEKIKYNDHKIRKYLPPYDKHKYITAEGGSHKTENHNKHESSEHNSNNIELTEKFHHIKKTRKGSKHHEDSVEDESNEVVEENHHDKPLSPPEPNSYTESVSSHHEAESNDIHSDFGTQHQQQEFQGSSLEHHEQSNYVDENSGYDSEIKYKMTEETIHETIEEQTDKPLATVNFQHFIEVPIGSSSFTQSENEQYSGEGNSNSDSSNEQFAQAQYSENSDSDVNNQFGNNQQEVGNNLESTNSETSSNHVPSSSSSNDTPQYHYGSGNSQSSGEVAGGIVYKNDVLHQHEHDTMSNSISHENHAENALGNTGGDYHENFRQGHNIVGSGKHNSVDTDSNSEREDVQEAIRNLEDILQSLESTGHMENTVEKVLDEGPQFSDGKQLHSEVVHDQSQGYSNTHDLSPEYLENVIRQEEAGEIHHPHQQHHIQEHGDTFKWKRNAQNKKSRVVRVKVDRKRV